jgi:hypothetical protein
MSAGAPVHGAASAAAQRDAAAALGRRLADLVDDPEVFTETLAGGLAKLSEPAYRAMVEAVSPGIPADYAVPGPLREAVAGPVRAALRHGSSGSALYLAQRLAATGHRDLRLYALPCLRRSLPEDPERSWQLLRGMAAGAGDWIEVDSLAEVWAVAILAEAFRWAELEQLVYSPRTFERRLVGATLATLPHRVPAARRGELRDGLSRRSMDLLAMLMGDAEEMVQKALSWAIRNWTRVDPEAVAAFLEAETEKAEHAADGARAWVIRDSLTHQPPERAAALRLRLAGLRRDRRTPSTSLAASRSAGFAALIEAHDAAAHRGDRTTRSRA